MSDLHPLHPFKDNPGVEIFDRLTASPATIVEAHSDGTNAFVAVVINDGGSRGNVEYNANTPLQVNGVNQTLPQLKATLISLLSAQRTAQLAVPQALALTGSVNI